ncbi:ABC-type Fe3+-citrate transport system, periplasmic component [Dermatophilus congolensis]|uniref:ABC-type Fe3+-citrate transport system, periplasmic component n=1 Tax=Dermatophilus congolensis TaxID=1863 RepID=A0A239VA66_9MICO|nr:ABC transporter substrate-binding protein [Dermatophilus congolensis]SNV19035.1 ABC-type Fe3+-citrate transport system, periplasmic component [Dermatophilus congolensis]
MRPHPRHITAATCTLLLAACAGAPTSPTNTNSNTAPITLTNCGEKITVTTPPRRLVTLNQGATETALALGLAPRMAGTAYLDDTIAPTYKTAYATVPVLAKEYPSKEQFLAAKPDFAYSAYASAFTDKAVGTRNELTSEGINTYTSPFGCPKGTPTAEATFENGWNEIAEIAKIFAVTPTADALITTQKKHLDEIRTKATGKNHTIFWYDSGDKTPTVGAGAGGPHLIMNAVGATNIFDNLPGGWSEASWEKVVAANPDVIVLADASWNTAEKKKNHLTNDPVLSQLDAVKNNRFITIPFSESTPGVRLVDGARSVSDQLAQLDK